MAKIKSPQMDLLRETATQMAYLKGATEDNVKEIAGNMRIVDIAEFIKANREWKDLMCLDSID